MYEPSEEVKKLVSNTVKRISKSIKECRYDLAELHTEHLFRQLMEINDADAMKKRGGNEL